MFNYHTHEPGVAGVWTIVWHIWTFVLKLTHVLRDTIVCILVQSISIPMLQWHLCVYIARNSATPDYTANENWALGWNEHRLLHSIFVCINIICIFNHLTFFSSIPGYQVTLSISILISLHVFFLLVVEIIPPTSLVVPLLGKYLIFAMILVSIRWVPASYLFNIEWTEGVQWNFAIVRNNINIIFGILLLFSINEMIAFFGGWRSSICVTVVVLNVHFRSPQTHRMAPWVKTVFINFLPKLLFIKRPQYSFETR